MEEDTCDSHTQQRSSFGQRTSTGQQYNRSCEADPEEAPAAKPDNLLLKERTDSQKLSFGHHIRAAASVPLSPKTTRRNNEQRRAWEVRQFTAVIPVLIWKTSARVGGVGEVA